MNIIFLIVAIITLSLAHFIKILRWRLFIEIYEEPRNRNLIQALSLGYLINLFFPFRVIGDFFRAIYSGRKMKNNYSLSFSTVIVDRILDIITVGILFYIFYVFSIYNKQIEKSFRFYMLFSVLIISLIILFYFLKRYIKIISLKVASLFNTNIELNILKFMWALIWNFKDIFLKINKFKILIITTLMWLLYTFSYYLFSLFLLSQNYNFRLVDIFFLLFSKDIFGTDFLLIEKKVSMFFYIYMITPIIIMLLISKFLKIKSYSKKVHIETEDYFNLFPNQDNKEKLEFLRKYFLDKDKSYIDNYLKINQKITIIRDFSAGSNATTMLCMKKDKIFYRKYAFEDIEKLYEQVEWIIENEKRNLPLPKIIRKEKTGSYCYYDMLYKPSSIPLFEYIHSMPFEETWEMIENILKKLEEVLYINNLRKADTESINKYIDLKVRDNIAKIYDSKALKKLLRYDEVIINGKPYKNLSYYLEYLSKEYLYNIFKEDIYSDIHGDLTIENIICNLNTMEEKYYIIDPNSGNINNSANLDYAKILQSIHGGYEFMMRTYDVSLEENQINFLFTKSQAYFYLYKKLNEYMNLKFSKEKIRSIYFHEIVHWLRLMPYKLKKDGKRALIFYSGLLMVLNNVIEKYGDRDENKKR
ncbi:lysylphosphatidylglycerol synthase transmembrane domain-containing protein [Fusobacterium nucleatum]|uniref:lysylphosphatidylglycerol synthase transmembrane domain-containing protein n=1 Tax=Fusobacterium nucleatum TaxID=851 RepID=UPI00235EB7B8|nr:lysylphosphatidylglycerol synthase transmembrane domain-containing protein [Fusobacterium nucleatum]WDD89230.1 lysylphosphatidylglycerol synthase transmembrane domain-containing protein [Fusobacterium nucleatum]